MAILGRRGQKDSNLPQWSQEWGQAARDRGRGGLGSWAAKRGPDGQGVPDATGEPVADSTGGARKDGLLGGAEPDGSATVR